MKTTRHLSSSALLVLLTLLPEAARACDQCMGARDSHIRPAVNGAIFFMLGVVGFMLGSVGLFMRYLAKRSHLPMAPHDQLVRMMSMPTDHV